MRLNKFTILTLLLAGGLLGAVSIQAFIIIPHPLSFHAFFPSLKELIPTHSFVTRSGDPIDVTDLTAQNKFLQSLDQTKHRLKQRGIRAHTIAGNELGTLSMFSYQACEPRMI